MKIDHEAVRAAYRSIDRTVGSCVQVASGGCSRAGLLAPEPTAGNFQLPANILYKVEQKTDVAPSRLHLSKFTYPDFRANKTVCFVFFPPSSCLTRKSNHHCREFSAIVKPSHKAGLLSILYLPSSSLYRGVHLGFTPEIELLCMLFYKSFTFFKVTSLKRDTQCTSISGVTSISDHPLLWGSLTQFPPVFPHGVPEVVTFPF